MSEQCPCGDLPQFKVGDTIQMTDETRKVNSGARSFIGIVINNQPDCSGQIKIRRVGLKTVETWHQSAWQLNDAQGLCLTGRWGNG